MIKVHRPRHDDDDVSIRSPVPPSALSEGDSSPPLSKSEDHSQLKSVKSEPIPFTKPSSTTKKEATQEPTQELTHEFTEQQLTQPCSTQDDDVISYSQRAISNEEKNDAKKAERERKRRAREETKKQEKEASLRIKIEKVIDKKQKEENLPILSETEKKEKVQRMLALIYQQNKPVKKKKILKREIKQAKKQGKVLQPAALSITNPLQMSPRLILEGTNRTVRLPPLQTPYSLISVCGRYVILVLWQRLTATTDKEFSILNRTTLKRKAHDKRTASCACLVRVIHCPPEERLHLIGEAGIKNPKNSFIYPSFPCLCERIIRPQNAQRIWYHLVIQDNMTYRVNIDQWRVDGNGPGYLPGLIRYTEEDLERMKDLAVKIREDTKRLSSEKKLSTLHEMGIHFNQHHLPEFLRYFVRVLPTNGSPKMHSGVRSASGLVFPIPRPTFKPLFLSFANPNPLDPSHPTNTADKNKKRLVPCVSSTVEPFSSSIPDS